MNYEKKYQHIISLGFFCGIAQDLETLGIRSKSYPFDWIISDWSGIELVMQKEFQDIFEIEYFFQYKLFRERYKNIKYGFSFYHDFNSKIALNRQIDIVRDKYLRRINRLYEDIKKQTLFMRYIQDIDELEYILTNSLKINEIIKEFNPDNEIVYIINEEFANHLMDTTIKFFIVKCDKNDIVSRHPIISNRELKEYVLSWFPKELIEHNKEWLRIKKRKSITSRVIHMNKIVLKIKQKLIKDYTYDRQIL